MDGRRQGQTDRLVDYVGISQRTRGRASGRGTVAATAAATAAPVAVAPAAGA